jgi:hypothetical protein
MVSDGMGGPVGEVVSGAGAPGAVDDAGGSGVPVSVTVGTGAGCWCLPAAPLISTRRIRPTTIATTTAPANTIATISGPLLFRGDGVGVDACQALPSQYRRFGAPEGSGYQPEPDGPVITHGHYAAADQRPPEQQWLSSHATRAEPGTVPSLDVPGPGSGCRNDAGCGSTGPRAGLLLPVRLA